MKRSTPLLLLALALVGATLVYSLSPDVRREVNAAARLTAQADIAPIRAYLLGFGVWAPVASTLLQIFTSVLAPLPSFVITFVNAALFGFWWGALLPRSSALLAAAICFGMARVLGRPVVERLMFPGMLGRTDTFFARHGVLAVLVARLIPFVNPDVLSYAAGLTPMRWPLFLASIALGSLPSTVLYTYLGDRGVTSVGWLLLPLVGLGLLTFAGALWRHTRQSQKSP